MSHLDEVGMGYFGHLRLAWLNALRLLAAFAALVVHGAFPFIFVHTASGLLGLVMGSIPRGSRDRVLIRFNTKWKDDPEGRQWRVLVNGEESLASGVSMRVEADTVEEEISGEQKFHFLCLGRVLWHGSFAEVV